MTRTMCILLLAVLVTSNAAVRPQDKPQVSDKKVPNGAYRVLRDGPSEKDVAPLNNGETIVVDRQRYAKEDETDPPRFLVVHTTPEVDLDLAREPMLLREGADVRILLKLRPKAAEALERVTREHPDGRLTIVLGGEVITTHKIRSVIKDGDVQITSCTPGAVDFLLEQLQAAQKKR